MTDYEVNPRELKVRKSGRSHGKYTACLLVKDFLTKDEAADYLIWLSDLVTKHEVDYHIQLLERRP